jgi:hypothetical protein
MLVAMPRMVPFPRSAFGLESLAVPRPTILYFSSAVVFCAALAAFFGVTVNSVLSDSHVPAAQATSPSGSQKQGSERIRVAEGQYDIFEKANEGGIGPFLPAVYNFRESWTLSRLPDGSLQADGEREYESPKDEFHHHRFSVHLSSEFRALGVTEFRTLRWRRNSGPLSCDFLPAELICTSGEKDSRQRIRLDMPMKDAYGFLWPISAFSMSSITRSVDRDPGRTIPVQLVMVDEPSRELPVDASVLNGYLKYLGQDKMILAGRKWNADKFELKVPLYSPFLIWTSPEGFFSGLLSRARPRTRP